MPRKYYHTYPQVRKKTPTNYSPLFSAEEYAKMRYNKDMNFRKFVHEWNADWPELMGWSLTDFYLAYQSQGVQLKLRLA